MSRLNGKIAVVVGGNSGIGLATAKAFHREGASVVITGRDAKSLATAAKEVGENVLTVVSDISSLAGIDHFIDAVRQKHGRIDVLFVNAGVAHFAPFEAFTEKDFDALIATNFKGLYFTVQKALPLLSRGSSVIFTTSSAAQLGQPTTSVYAATKAAVRSLARTLAAELIPKGIRVNAVSPGPIKTPIFGRMGVTPEKAAEIEKNLAATVPMGRIGNADEVANAAVFLASDDSSFTYGAELPVDGGKAQL